MSKKLDPRVLRTRKLLSDSLLELIREQGYDNITIQNITDRATLNRSTFYMHYKDKDDLIEHIIANVLKDLSRIPPQDMKRETNVAYVERVYKRIFQHVRDNFDFYRVMLGERSVAPFTQQMQARIEALGTRWASPREWDKVTTPPELFVSFISSAFLGVVRWWLAQEMPYSPEEMARHFTRLTLVGMHREFGLPPDDII